MLHIKQLTGIDIKVLLCMVLVALEDSLNRECIVLIL